MKCVKNDPGIYRLWNTLTGESYVGKANSIRKRIPNHFASLRSGTHVNKNLQRSCDQYGVHVFRSEILELQPAGLCSYNQLAWFATRERFHIEKFAPTFNIAPTTWFESDWTIEGHTKVCICAGAQKAVVALDEIPSGLMFLVLERQRQTYIEDVRLAMDVLTERERWLIDRIYHLTLKFPDQSMASLGREMGITGEMVSQIHKKALSKMLKVMTR